MKKKMVGLLLSLLGIGSRSPPGDGGVDDNVRSSALADSWPTRTDGEKITPRQVGETGAGDGGGDGALAFTSLSLGLQISK